MGPCFGSTESDDLWWLNRFWYQLQWDRAWGARNTRVRMIERGEANLLQWDRALGARNTAALATANAGGVW